MKKANSRLTFPIADNLKTDILYELDIVDFDDDAECDNSYHYILTNLEINYKNKDRDDNSLSAEGFDRILRILHGDCTDLQSAYFRILQIIEDEDSRSAR